MCDVLNVSETGYYRFKRNLGKPSKDAVLSEVMQEILDEYIYNDNYGVDRMQIALRNRGYKVGRRRIIRIMKAALRKQSDLSAASALSLVW